MTQARAMRAFHCPKFHLTISISASLSAAHFPYKRQPSSRRRLPSSRRFLHLASSSLADSGELVPSVVARLLDCLCKRSSKEALLELRADNLSLAKSRSSIALESLSALSFSILATMANDSDLICAICASYL